MSLINVVPYVLGMTPGVPGAPKPRMYPRSGYFLVNNIIQGVKIPKSDCKTHDRVCRGVLDSWWVL